MHVRSCCFAYIKPIVCYILVVVVLLDLIVHIESI